MTMLWFGGGGMITFSDSSSFMWFWIEYILSLYSIDTHFDTPTIDSFENIVGKREIARNEQFLLFPQCFPLNKINVFPFVHIFSIISLFAAEFEDPKIGIEGKG